MRTLILVAILHVGCVNIRPFQPHMKEFYEVLRNIESMNGYVCRHAVLDFWRKIRTVGDGSKAHVGYLRGWELHAILEKDGKFYDPSFNIIKTNFPPGFRPKYVYNHPNDVPTWWDYELDKEKF